MYFNKKILIISLITNITMKTCKLCNTQSNKCVCPRCYNIICVKIWNNWVKDTPIKKKKKVVRITRFETVEFN